MPLVFRKTSQILSPLGFLNRVDLSESVPVRSRHHWAFSIELTYQSMSRQQQTFLFGKLSYCIKKDRLFIIIFHFFVESNTFNKRIDRKRLSQEHMLTWKRVNRIEVKMGSFAGQYLTDQTESYGLESNQSESKFLDPNSTL